MSDAEAAIRQRNRSSLNPTQRVILDVLQECGDWTAMGALHDAYCERTAAVTRQTLRRHLRKLGTYNLVEQKGSKRGRRYRALER